MRLATAHERRRGIVLLAVLIVVALLALAAYGYYDLMQAEARAADSYARSTQARAMAESGINYTAMVLANKEAYDALLTGNPYDNPDVFANVLVQDADAPRARGRFSIIAPLGPDDSPGNQPFRYGVIDESGKLNLNGLLKIDSSGETAKNMLMKLPGMAEEVANSILDWIDTDEDTRAGGAETDYYQGLSPGYPCKNGPLETLEELLYVKGVTPQLLFGNDYNRNGILDPEEGGERDLGWAAYLTVYGREQNVDSLGKPRVYINDSNTQRLYDSMTQIPGMSPELAGYIILYRRYGPAQIQGLPPIAGLGSIPDLTGALQGSVVNAEDIKADQLGLSTRSRGRRRIASMFELVGSFVQLPGGDMRSPPRYVASPLNSSDVIQQYLPILLEKMTTSKDTDLPARVNVLTAPRQVLMALPGIQEKDVEGIMQARPSVLAQGATSDAIFSAATQIFLDANLSLDTLRAIERYITVRTQMYRIQVVGHFDSGGPFFRAEAIIDTNNGRPRIVYWRDLTELGRGFVLPPASN